MVLVMKSKTPKFKVGDIVTVREGLQGVKYRIVKVNNNGTYICNSLGWVVSCIMEQEANLHCQESEE